ncbi:MAG: alanine racemase [Collinsella sp.]|nr:alanine racemase [Collinsella sp.]
MTDKELLALAADFGTPTYVFDARAIADRVKRLAQALPSSVELCYAIKANPFVLPILSPLVDRLEVCSPGELDICGACSIDPDQIVVSGVHKDEEAMRPLMQADVLPHRFTIESAAQLELIHRLARDAGVIAPVLLRLSSGNQFGLDARELRDIVDRRESHPHLDFRGVQFFSGTQKRRARRLVREIERLGSFVESLRTEQGWTASELEIGPGLPVAYFDSDSFDEGALLSELSRALCDLPFEGSVSLEIGRSLVASCGTFLTSVVDAKTCAGQRYAIVDGGMNHLVYYGQSMAMQLPPCRLLGSTERDGDAEPWNICGSLCSVNDILAKQVPFSGLSLGDVIAFEDAGAYCMTEGISLFLSRDLPAVVLVGPDGEARLMRPHTPTHPLNSPVAR